MPSLHMVRRTVLSLVLVAAGALLAVPGFADHPKHQIDALNAQWVAAFKAGDYAAIGALMTSDALLLAPGKPPIQGAAAVVETWKSWGELSNVALDFGALHIEVAASGELAYDYGTYDFAFDSDTGPVNEKGKYIVIWKKIDGAWKVAADIFNDNGTE